MKATISLALCCLSLTACRHVEQDRFLADARINDKPVRLAYDTGAERSVIFTRTVKRVGIKGNVAAHGKAEPGKVTMGLSGLCKLKVNDEEYKIKMGTLKLPWWWGMDVDGLIGWPDMTDDVVEIDAATASIKGLEKLPDETTNWLKLPLYKHTGVLALAIPRADGKPGVVEIDTGNSAGVSLSPERWREWRASHPKTHWNWTLHMMPGSGAILGRRYTADELEIGPIKLNNVQIRKSNRTELAIPGKEGVSEGSIGFNALERMRLIVDQKNEVAYLQPKPVLVVTNGPYVKSVPKTKVFAEKSTVKLRFRADEYFYRGMDEFMASKFDDALADYGRFSEMEPGNAWGHALFGEALYHVGVEQGNATNFERAIGELSRALDSDPGIAAAYYLRGNARFLARQWDDALKDYRRVGEMIPEQGAYANFYSWLIREQSGDRAAADGELEKFAGKGGSKLGNSWQGKIASFLLGQVSEDDFLGAANARDEKNQGWQQCEAWFYAGMKRRLAKDVVVANDYLRKSVATEQKGTYEYGFAKIELKDGANKSN